MVLSSSRPLVTLSSRKARLCADGRPSRCHATSACNRIAKKCNERETGFTVEAGLRSTPHLHWPPNKDFIRSPEIVENSPRNNCACPKDHHSLAAVALIKQCMAVRCDESHKVLPPV